MGLGIVVIMILMGWGERIVGFLLGRLVISLVVVFFGFFVEDFFGNGDCSFCFCCFFWIFCCNCCLVLIGDGKVFIWGWKELFLVVGIKVEGWGIFLSFENKYKGKLKLNIVLWKVVLFSFFECVVICWIKCLSL